jgi:hypothetical protein
MLLFLIGWAGKSAPVETGSVKVGDEDLDLPAE